MDINLTDISRAGEEWGYKQRSNEDFMTVISMYSHPQCPGVGFRTPQDTATHGCSSPYMKWCSVCTRLYFRWATAGCTCASLSLRGFSVVLGIWQIQVLLFGTFEDFFFKYFQWVVGWIRRSQTGRYREPTVPIFWHLTFFSVPITKRYSSLLFHLWLLHRCNTSTTILVLFRNKLPTLP